MLHPVKSNSIKLPHGLSDTISSALKEFAEAAIAALGDDLISLVLFGSAAEARMRTVSDVNLLVILAKFDVARINGLRESLRAARVQINLAPMFICRSELPEAAEAFAVKFDDIIRRHFTLFGENLIDNLSLSREARLLRVKQVLLNLELRLRERYAMASLRDEQLIGIIVDMSSALRSAVASVIDLEGGEVPSAREALADAIAKTERSDLKEAVVLISQAREQGYLPAGSATRTLLAMLEIAAIFNERLRRIS